MKTIWIAFALAFVGPLAAQPQVTKVPVLFSQTQTVTVTGTTSETTLAGTGVGSLSLPANYFTATGDTLHIRYHGTNNNGSSATQYTVKLKLGGTTIASGVSTPSASALAYGCSLDITITARSVGVSGTVLVTGAGYECARGDDTSFDLAAFTATSPVTVNTTGSLTFDLTITPGNSAQSFTTTNLVLTPY